MSPITKIIGTLAFSFVIVNNGVTLENQKRL